jgi:hypothetical protein
MLYLTIFSTASPVEFLPSVRIEPCYFLFKKENIFGKDKTEEIIG